MSSNSAGPPAPVTVWWAAPAAGHHRLAHLLDPAETGRLARIRPPAARDLFVTAHVLARLVAAEHLEVAPAEVAVAAECVHCGGPHGRPAASARGRRVRLSLSHSGRRVAVAVSAGAWPGVDVEAERLRDPGGRLPLGALSPAEQAVVAKTPAGERTAAFVRYWTRKEALLKATGQGLVVPPRLVTVSPPDEAPRLLGWAATPAPADDVFMVDLSPGPGYSATLAVMGRRPSVTQTDGTALLQRLAG